MTTLDPYNLREIVSQTAQTTTYRATDPDNEQNALVRYIHAESLSLLARSRFRQELEIAQDLNIKGVLRPLRTQTHQDKLLLILEDFDGISLSQLVEEQTLDIKTRLTLAINLLDVIQALHQEGIIHKNINADAILVNPQSFEVRLTDFGLASRISKETREQSDLKTLSTNLAYISPEQTGRMNRYIDYRSDFYSLGVTLYRLFTGQLPFESEDPMELVHSHIARPPAAPHVINPTLPAAISRIILKLLSKIAEDRYHSAAGIREDLVQCRDHYTSPKFNATFEPGGFDIPDRFQIPQKLYGRQIEIENLLNAFDRVSRGTVEFVLVSGYAGIGKSSIVLEVQRPIARERGYFVQGKFDQFKRDVPFSSIIQAFRELVRQILSEQDDQLEIWRTNLSQALGTVAQVLIEVIPEIELILGPQPPVPVLGPTEAQNRFRLVFQRFIHVFAGKNHPLVVFLDDLQWADTATLDLIETLGTDPELSHLLFIGAFRDNEIDAAHPFTITLDNLHKAGPQIHEIKLGPLSLEDLDELISDTLYCTPEQSRPLSQLVYNKTAGNPFFIMEFLKTLYTRGLIWFDKSDQGKGSWAWDLKNIENARITENVVELLVDNIQQLSQETRQALQLAACIGNRFDLKMLSIARETQPYQTATTLWDAIQQEFIRPVDDTFHLAAVSETSQFLGNSMDMEDYNIAYVFQHDRIQQAAYSLIPDVDKRQTHLKIGRLMLQHGVLEDTDEQLFEVTNHLNQGLELITDPEERRNLAALNLRAGQKAKTSTAYQQALTCLRAGAALLPDNVWQQEYTLAFHMHSELATCEYLTNHFEAAESRFETILDKAQRPLDKLSVYNTKVRLLQHAGREIESIEAGLAGLRLMGLEFPMHPGKLDLVKNLLKVMAAQGRKDIPDLIHLPDKMTPETRATMDILMNLWGVTFWINQDLNGLLVLQMVLLSLKHGNADASSVAYVCFGVLQNVLGNVPKGLQYGKLSVDLAEQFDNAYLNSKVAFISTSFFFHYTAPLRDTVERFRQGLKYSLESGEFIYAGYCSNMMLWIMSPAGFALDKVLAESKNLIDTAYQIKNMQCVVSLQIVQRWAIKLSGATEDLPDFDNKDGHPVFAVDIFHAEAGRYDMELGAFYLWELQLQYLFGDYQKALEAIEKLQGNTIIEPTWAYLPSVYHLYSTLTLATLYPEVSAEEQKDFRKRIRKSLKTLKKYTSLYPDTFKHKFQLASAAWEQINGDVDTALALFEDAGTSALANGFTQNAAIAYEQKGLLLLRQNNTISANAYLSEARDLYLQWGATTRATYLESKYPETLSPRPTTAGEQAHAEISSLDSLDLRTVIKASQTISGEIVLDRLLVTLMRNVMSNAGAERGTLLLYENHAFVIEAEGTVTPNQITVLQSMPLEQAKNLATSIINYVARTHEPVVLDNAALSNRFSSDAYIQSAMPRSVLCMPLFNQGKLTGILYLENNLTTGAFTPDRIELLQLLSAEITISIENARLYNNLEQKVTERTQELHEKNNALAATLEHLEQTKDQLVQAEKLASLGELAAGIAHEIKNPLNFINNFSRLNEDLAKDLRSLIETPAEDENPGDKEQEIKDMLSYLEINARKITAYGTRADNIVKSMMTHANGVPGKRELTDVKTLIAEVLKGTKTAIAMKYPDLNVDINTSYQSSNLQAPVRRQEVGRVLNNLLDNSVYALHERSASDPAFQANIEISAGIDGKWLEIVIGDNGTGIPESTRKKVFEPFFSTKPTGSGTGLGLSLSYDIIVKGHNGTLDVESQPGEYTRFTIRLPLNAAVDAR